MVAGARVLREVHAGALQRLGDRAQGVRAHVLPALLDLGNGRGGQASGGGELVLETLVVEGDENTALVPEDRYAQMRNVWFLPSVPALERWLRRAGFVDVRCVDVSTTSVDEQRSTDWMRYQSLPDFLDPQDHGRTVEGLPAPMRAVLLARKP